jgi:hypothetical protein
MVSRFPLDSVINSLLFGAFVIFPKQFFSAQPTAVAADNTYPKMYL